MKSLQLALATVLAVFSLTAFSQPIVNIAGNVDGAPVSGATLTITLTTDDGVTNITTIVTTDAAGNFSYSAGVSEALGTAVATLQCNGFLSDTQTQYWYPNDLDLYFQFTWCSNVPDDCNADFWAWNDTIIGGGTNGGDPDTLVLPPFNVWLINQSTGTDLNYFWDFGDGSYSTEAYPEHWYDEVGTYTICLWVTNSTCADTLCTTFTMTEGGEFIEGEGAQQGFFLNVVASITIAVEESANMQSELSVYPNPVADDAVISIKTKQAKMASFTLYNMQGQQLSSMRKALRTGLNQLPLEMSQLPAGNYVLRMTDEQGRANAIQITR